MDIRDKIVLIKQIKIFKSNKIKAIKILRP